MLDRLGDPTIERNDIIAAARIVFGVSSNEAEAKAINRGWLDHAGEATSEGRKMVEALGTQSGTRSVFR